jgi:hypothetical protein
MFYAQKRQFLLYPAEAPSGGQLRRTDTENHGETGQAE